MPIATEADLRGVYGGLPAPFVNDMMGEYPSGLLDVANIDAFVLPKFKNANGGYNTANAFSLPTPRGTVLLPMTREDGSMMTRDESVAEYEKTGGHLGVFSSTLAAEMHSRFLNAAQQEWFQEASRPKPTGLGLMSAAIKLTVSPAFPTAIDFAARVLSDDLRNFVWKEGEGWTDPAAIKTEFEPVRGYSAADEGFPLDGLSDNDLLRLLRSRSPGETMHIRQKIRAEKTYMAILAAGGARGAAALVGAGFLDPLLAASILVPLAAPMGTGTRAYRVGKSVAAVAALSATREKILHSRLETRTLRESAENIAIDTIVSGALGLWATRGMSSADRALMVKTFENMNPTMPTGSIGAGKSLDMTPDDAFDPAVGATWLQRTLGKASPAGRIIASSSKAAKDLLVRISSTTTVTKGNISGDLVNAPDLGAVVSKKERFKSLVFRRANDENYLEYVKRVREAGGTPMSQHQFGDEIVMASKRGDFSEVPEVVNALKIIREKVLSVDGKDLVKLGFLAEGIQQERLAVKYRIDSGEITPEHGEALMDELDDAMGDAVDEFYSMQMWDQPAIQANKEQFIRELAEVYTANPLLPKKSTKVVAAERRLGLSEKDNLSPDVAPTVIAAKEARGVWSKSVDAELKNRRTLRASAKALRQAERKLAVVEKEIARLEKEKAAIPGQTEELVTAKADLAAQYDEAREAVKKATAARAEANAVLRGSRKGVTQAAESLRRAERVAFEEGRVLDDLELKQRYLREDMAGATPAKLDREESRLAKQIEVQQGKVAIAEGEVQAARNQAIEASSARDEAREAVSDAAEELRVLGGEVRSLRRELDAIKVKDPDNLIAKLDSRIEAMRARGMKLDEERALRQTEATTADELRETLKQEAREARDTFRAAKKEADADRADLARIREYYRWLNEEKARIRTPEMIRATALDSYNRIMGLDSGHSDLGAIVTPRTLRERKIHIPPEKVDQFKKWWVTDYDMWSSAYTRSSTATIEAKRLGFSKGLKDEIASVEKEYDDKSLALMAKADELRAKHTAGELTDEQLDAAFRKLASPYLYARDKARKAVFKDYDVLAKMQKNLDREKAVVINDLEAIGDRIFHKRGIASGNIETIKWVRLGRIARNISYQRLMGFMPISSMVDIGKIVATYGAPETAKRLAALVSDPAFYKMSREEALQALTATDVLLDTAGTARDLADVADAVTSGYGPLAKTDMFLGEMSRHYTRWVGMARTNEFLKIATATLQADKIVQTALHDMGMASLSPFKQGVMRSLGIGEDTLAIIKQQVQKHGEVYGDRMRPRTELWDKTPAAQEAAHRLEIAVMKAADVITSTRVASDLPLVFDYEVAKPFLQFKSFNFTSVQKTMVPLAQGIAHYDVASMNGLSVLLSLGAMRYVLGELAAGREPDLSPARVMGEAFNWSGLLGYLPDLASPLISIAPEPIRSLQLSKQKRSGVENLLGPSVGTTADLMSVIAALTGPTDPNNPLPSITEADIHKFRKLAFGQNIWYLRNLLNGLEGETAEAIGAADSQPMTFGERVTALKPLDPSVETQ